MRYLVDLSISIVSFNTIDLLSNCLASIFEHTTDISFEVLVVDNASQDGTPGMVMRNYPQVKLIVNQKNLGFAAANNQALRESVGKYVLLLNSDTIVLPNALTKLVNFMDAKPDIGVLGCKLLNPDGSLQRSCRSFPTLQTEFFEKSGLNRLFPKSRLFGKYKMTYWDFDDLQEVDQPSGACLLVRRDAIDEVDLMDETFFMYWEDVDWCYRIKQANWKIYYTPAVEIIHLGGQSSQKARSDMLIARQKSQYHFFQKHHGHFSTQVLRLMTLLEMLGKFVLWAFTFFFKNNRRMETKERLATYREIFRLSLFDRNYVGI